MSLAYIGLGANLGDAHTTLNQAIDDLAQLPDARVMARSSFYRTAPVDATGPDYVNAVVALDTALDPSSLLSVCQAIETLHGRVRPGDPAVQNAPRTLDLDLLLHGDTVVNTPDLTLPHPRMHQRAFVLAPLAEIAPTVAIPGHGPASECLKRLAGQRISRISG